MTNQSIPSYLKQFCIFRWQGLSRVPSAAFLSCFVSVPGLAEPELVFPCSSPHGAVFYVGSWQGVDSALVLRLLLSGAYTAPRLLLTFPPPTVGRGGKDLGRGHNQDSWPELTKGIFHTIWRLLSIKLGERRKGVGSPFVLQGNHYAYRRPLVAHVTVGAMSQWIAGHW